MNPIPCTVRGVFMTVTNRGAAPTVVLDTEEGASIPIFVGVFEALSISNAIRGEVTPRPITHDLCVDLLKRFNIGVMRLHVDSLEGGVFYSRLICSGNESEEIVDCRPSDGIAIALRVKAPILISEEVVADAAVDRDTLSNLTDFSEFLDHRL